ncbi:hypothetical protein NQ314_013603 [Rhamnusium bicolor]|uniref:PiggyBac transposable element-derived protein domain-containing protein n=1 Tax=Rhamnusium bicolor TaxID=1586634 RepID=A0AAV8X649_9CUCU|nr:hypothetical protein NQ314_013603 [Rhamnusium bicolor]
MVSARKLGSRDMASYEEQQEHLRRLMEEVPTDEEAQTEYDDQSDAGEVDFVEVREDDSDTEQDISDGEAEDLSLNELCFIGKDKATKWMKQVPTKTVRTRKEDKVLRLPISRLATRTLKTPIEIFKYFINDEMVDHIITEIHALLGLLFYVGVLKANRLNLEELRKLDSSGVEMFRLTMSIKRFKFLLTCLRFDNKQTREERKKIDKLAPIREFFDLFLGNCKTGYSPSENVTTDEKLGRFRGRCSFRQYIPSKPKKYEIKIFAHSDAKMYYTMNLEVYVGQQPDGPYKVSNSSNCIVERRCEPIKGSGRNLTIDNWFTSVPFVEKLYKKIHSKQLERYLKIKKSYCWSFHTQRIHPVQVCLVP